LPAWQADALARQTKPAREPVLFAEILAAGVYNVRRRQVLLEQRLALLRHIEALRIYAAEHSGTLPMKLSEISVPLPDDPFTGKPFHYAVNGTTAHVRGIPPAGMETDSAYNIHYEVTLTR
jgi:hypothetical protein